MEEQPVDRPIRVIGRYALYGKLASGGMATVHFGWLLGPAGFSRTVAIKRLHPQFAKDPEFVAMFLDEARLAARIQHPNVVATVDVVAMAEELFLVMDYIRGESFSRLLRASRKKRVEVPLGTIASVLAGMLHGLHAAHEAKDEQGRPLSVVHRDVSPQNVLVGIDGVTRVLDFGVAKAAARVQVTRDGQMKGKLAYMAPEQLNGTGVDRRTDIFAAGIVLWEALTGRRLFDAEDASEVLRMITTEEIPPPSAVVPSIARNIDAIVMKALARDPSRRFQTAREFAIALEDATHLGSAREVGEWVERVAGETLLNREQAVAEIEAVSSVSEVSLVTESSPGHLKTLDGIGVASQVPRRAPSKPDRKSPAPDRKSLSPDRKVPAPPPTIPDAAREWEEEPTGKFAASSPGNARPAMDSTQVHVPRPSSPALKKVASAARVPPSSAAPKKAASTAPVPPSFAAPKKAPSTAPARPPAPPVALAALGFDDENETTNVFDPKKHGFDDENETTNVFDPKKHGFDDENETTNVFDPKKHGFDDENETTNVFDPKKHGFDDENEKTAMFAPRDSVPASPALPTRRTNRPPTPPPAQRPISSHPPVPRASVPTAAVPISASVIVQEHTDPVMFRHRPTVWGATYAWFWHDPRHRTWRVALAAGVVAMLGGFALVTARGSHGARPRRVAGKPAIAAPVAPAAPPVASSVVVARAEAPEPRGVDPSTLPADEGEQRNAPPALVVPVPAPASPPETVKASRVAARPGGPEPKIVKLDEEPTLPARALVASAVPPPAAAPPPADRPEDEDPYAKAPKAKASAPVQPPAAPAPPKAAAAEPKAPAKSSGAPDCSQPFVVDEHGIRRIKPQCL